MRYSYLSPATLIRSSSCSISTTTSCMNSSVLNSDQSQKTCPSGRLSNKDFLISSNSWRTSPSLNSVKGRIRSISVVTNTSIHSIGLSFVNVATTSLPFLKLACWMWHVLPAQPLCVDSATTTVTWMKRKESCSSSIDTSSSSQMWLEGSNSTLISPSLCHPLGSSSKRSFWRKSCPSIWLSKKTKMIRSKTLLASKSSSFKRSSVMTR